MDENDIAAIKARWANATPGPWQVAFHGVYEVEAPPNQLVADVGICGRAKEDAEAIAAAPQDIAWLLAALEARNAEFEAAREGLRMLRAALSEATDDLGDFARRTQDRADAAAAMRAHDALARYDARASGEGT